MATRRKCVFCGNTNLSNEHIFAQWLLKELGIMDNTVRMTHSSSFGMELSNRQHPFSKLVNGLVCEKCNNGWMSELESSCQSHIINLMNMQNVEEEIKFLGDNNDLIARWAFKNIILLNSASNYRQLVPENHYISLYNGEIPKGVTIDMAYARTEPSLEWRQSSGGILAKDKSIPTRLETCRYTITFQIKSLLFKVAFYESEYNVFYEDEGCIRLYPQYGLYGDLKVYRNIDDFDIHGVMHEYRV